METVTDENVLPHGDLKYIDSLEDFINLLQNNDEIVFIHGNRGGNSVLEFLNYSNNLNRICCVAMLVTEYSPLESISTTCAEKFSRRQKSKFKYKKPLLK